MTNLSVMFRTTLQIIGLLLQHHLKKMEGRRLDFDYKKKRQGKVTEDEIKQALEKFDDSKEIAEQSMFNLLESDVRRVSLQFTADSQVFFCGFGVWVLLGQSVTCTLFVCCCFFSHTNQILPPGVLFNPLF